MRNMKTDNKIRESNFELLRILSMFLIVLHHFSVYSENLFEPGSTGYLLHYMFSVGGKLGVNCFFLISGYFLCEKERNINKLFKLWGEIFFWSIAIFCFMVVANLIPFSVKDFIKSLFPISFDMYWFATTYFVLYLLFPYINKFTSCLGKKEMLNLIIILFCAWSIIPTFFNTQSTFSNFSWGFFLYLVGAYIRKYHNEKISIYKVWSLIIFILNIGIIFVSIVLIGSIGKDNEKLLDNIIYFAKSQSVFMAISSVSIFFLFKNLRIRDKLWINTISATTFGIYLIHDNVFFRNFIWKNHTITYDTVWNFILYSVIKTLMVFFYVQC